MKRLLRDEQKFESGTSNMHSTARVGIQAWQWRTLVGAMTHSPLLHLLQAQDPESEGVVGYVCAGHSLEIFMQLLNTQARQLRSMSCFSHGTPEFISLS